MGIDLSIIIVSWNVRDLLRECLRSVLAPMARSAEGNGYALDRRAVEVLVVDNASADGSADMVRSEFPGVLLVASDVNLGFAAGNNLGLRRARGRYVLLLNPDTVVRAGALAAMLGYLDAHPRVGLVGPLLRYGDGTVQPSRRRFPTFGHALMESTILEQWFPRNRWAREYRLEDVPIDGPLQVDWVNGSCMMVRSEAIAQVGLLDER
ncbi:MAG: glycosyltransferase family 2 protein, partial [Chloroflexi bacterium]|nr:glycosyltransferase family 2 protein [Chloroflexota bacterium]